MSATEKAASVTPPVQGQNLWVVAGADYAAVSYITIPQDWKFGYLTLRADGDKWYVAFSTSTTGNPSSSKTATSTVVANAFTAVGANNLEAIPDGAQADWDLALLDSHKVKTIILLSDTGAGHLRITRSSGPVA